MYKFTVSPYFVILDSVFYLKKNVLLYFLVEKVIFCNKHIANRKIFFQHCSPQVPTNPFAGKCVLMFYIIYVNGVLVLGVEQYLRAKNINMHQLCHNKLEMGWFLANFYF